MEPTLDEIKGYIKVDEDYDDYLIIDFKNMAECYLEEAGIKRCYNKATYKLAILMLCSYFYTNRSPIVEGSKYVEELPFGLRAIIQQLQFNRR